MPMLAKPDTLKASQISLAVELHRAGWSATEIAHGLRSGKHADHLRLVDWLTTDKGWTPRKIASVIGVTERTIYSRLAEIAARRQQGAQHVA